MGRNRRGFLADKAQVLSAFLVGVAVGFMVGGVVCMKMWPV